MVMQPALLGQRVRDDVTLACEYRKATGTRPGADDEQLMVNLGKALAAFHETIVTGRTSFDVFRDGSERGPAACGW